MINIYTDGSCRHRSGGYGYVVYEDNTYLFHNVWYENDTTNNRMEIKAVIAALHYIRKTFDKKEIYNVYTDSQYTSNGYNSWMQKWKKNGWMRTHTKPVLNTDLWREMHTLKFELPKVNLKWVKGHHLSEGNILIDKLVDVRKRAI